MSNAIEVHVGPRVLTPQLKEHSWCFYECFDQLKAICLMLAQCSLQIWCDRATKVAWNNTPVAKLYHVTIMWLSCDYHVVMWSPYAHHDYHVMWSSCDYSHDCHVVTSPPSPGNYVEVATTSDPCKRGAQLSLQFSCSVKEVHSFLERHGVMVREWSWVNSWILIMFIQCVWAPPLAEVPC